MKNNFLILILTLPIFVCQSVKSQQTEFAPIGATWYYSLADYSIPYPFTQLKYMKIVSVKDTIINNQTCRVLEEYRTDLYTPDNVLYYNKSHYVYSDSNIVFYLNPFTESFEVLYDFNKVQGEYWLSNSLGNSTDCDTVRVENTGSMQINQVILKTLNVIQQNCLAGYFQSNHQIVEVIGHLYYLFPQSDFSTEGPLRCYEDSIIGFYSSGISPSCDYIGLVNIIEFNEENIVNIFPNPFNEKFYIELSNFTKSIEIKIFDLLGICIFQKTYEADTKTAEINLNQAKDGMYIISINGKHFKIIKKK